MSMKRTFGLVGDYGSSSDSEDEDREVNHIKEKKPKDTDSSIKVNPPPPKSESVAEPELEAKVIVNESVNLPPPPASSKWAGVRKEYEDTSLMFKYIQETDEDTASIDKQDVNNKNTVIDAEKAAAEAIAAADAALASSKQTTVPTKNALDDPKAKSEYYQKVYEETLKAEQAKKATEEAARDWEIREIQREIEEERRKWDAAWSDDEGEGAESEAVFKDQKRRASVLQQVIDEVKKTNTKPEVEEKSYSRPKHGEGWKRLQIIAESRRQSEPEKYGSSYPNHKFPLRD